MTKTMRPNRNLATSLRRRSHGDPMRTYDALPADLRQWLAGAVLPWSALSVRRAWIKALKSARGDRQAACHALTLLERRRLEKDVVRVWGKAHPFLSQEAGKPARPPGAEASSHRI